MSVHVDTIPGRTAMWRVLTDEGLRLFFPLAALYAAVWPLMWVAAFQFDLPLWKTVPPSLWHAHEMLVGAFGAALIGFVTTAVPEWTDTPRLQGRALLLLAALWAIGRLVGVWGWDGASALGALADLGWMIVLVVYLLRVTLDRRTDRLLPFVLWISLLTITFFATRWWFATSQIEMAAVGLRLFGLAFLGLLGVALGRITVPVTNLVLDPTEKTSPFRPHPGRLNLASGMIMLVLAGEVFALGPAISGFLFIAAGASFMDKVGEAFIGRAALRAEILMLGGASALTGLGLLLVGSARLGAPWSEITGLHLAMMGGLGLGVMAVFSIAGLLHTGHRLDLPRQAKIAGLLLVFAALLRIAPDLLNISHPFDQPYLLASVLWAASFIIWLAGYWPNLSGPLVSNADGCAKRDPGQNNAR